MRRPLVAGAVRPQDSRVNLAAWWAVAGLVLLFGSAVFRLGSRGVDALAQGLSPSQWLLLLALTVLFVWGEGVMALARKWVPRALDRAAALRTDRRLYPKVLAPLHAMGLIGTPWRTALRAWAGVAAVVGAVLLLRLFPQPWRGIVDLAVSAALVTGIIAILVQARTVID